MSAGLSDTVSRDIVAAPPRSDLLFRFGAAIVILSLVLMIIGPWIAPHEVGRPTDAISQPPPALAEIPRLLWLSWTGGLEEPVYWFGTDSAGLDVFSRVLAAPRADVAIALGANLVSLTMGSLLGLAAGFSRAWLGALIMRISDLVQAFPVFITGMILVTLAGRSIGTIVLTLALLYTPIYIRLTRAEVLAQRQRGFVDAARALGVREASIALRHVLPNAMAPGADPILGHDRLRHPHDGGTVIRGGGRAATHARMGPDDRGRRRPDRAGRMVAFPVSRTRHLDHRLRLRGLRQRTGAPPCRMRAQRRCSRSATSASPTATSPPCATSR